MGHDPTQFGAECQASINNIIELRDKYNIRIEIKLYDKQKALELLGKHLGMFTDKVEHSGGVTLRRTINVNPTKGTK